MTNLELSSAVAIATDLAMQWCGDFKFHHLRLLLQAYPFGGGGLTDDWELFRSALANVGAMSELTEKERNRIETALNLIDRGLRPPHS